MKREGEEGGRVGDVTYYTVYTTYVPYVTCVTVPYGTQNNMGRGVKTVVVLSFFFSDDVVGL